MSDNSEDPAQPDRPEDPLGGSESEPAGFFPELIRRGLSLGFTGLFMTEEAVRKALGDSVPDNVLEYMVAQSDKTRQDFLERISREFGRALSAMDPVEIIKRLLEGRTVEVTARIRFVPESPDTPDDKA